MTVSEDPAQLDMLSIGKHCAVADCHQLDFLPFTCKSCGKVYCADHRNQQAHACSARTPEEQTAVCPLCALALRPREGESPDAAFARRGCSGG